MKLTIQMLDVSDFFILESLCFLKIIISVEKFTGGGGTAIRYLKVQTGMQDHRDSIRTSKGAELNTQRL